MGILRKLKKALFVILLVVVFGAIVPVLVVNYQKDYLANKKQRGFDVAIVLGAKVNDDGGLSPMLQDRVKKAAQIYKQGMVKKLLMTGDHGRADYDEVSAMKNYVLRLGVLEKDILTDYAGFSTYDSLYRAKEVFKVKKALIVTQRFHLKRAIYIARGLGIQVKGVPADARKYLSENFSITREVPASVKAFWQMVLKPKPRLNK